MKYRANSTGFTIIELMIASMVFSAILLLITVGIINVGRAFTKSVNQSKTQEVARTIIEDISQAIQFSGATITKQLPPDSGYQGFCIGNRRYSYKLDERNVPGTTPYTFVVDNPPACNGATSPKSRATPVDGVELISGGMSLDDFSVTQNNLSEPNLWTISIRVVYGDSTIDLGPEDPVTGVRTCKNSQSSEYCATSSLTTTVLRRVD